MGHRKRRATGSGSPGGHHPWSRRRSTMQCDASAMQSLVQPLPATLSSYPRPAHSPLPAAPFVPDVRHHYGFDIVRGSEIYRHRVCWHSWCVADAHRRTINRTDHDTRMLSTAAVILVSKDHTRSSPSRLGTEWVCRISLGYGSWKNVHTFS